MYFDKSRKFSKSIPILKTRVKKSKKRLDTLEHLQLETDLDINEIKEKMIELRLIKSDKAGTIKKRVEPRKPYKIYKASCGWDILVGRSNRENDELTLKIAAKYDYWFHAWQASGSHVVLRLPDKTVIPDKQTLLEAASLAAYYSKARGASKVPVVYTQAKYVRKPKKFPPGKVLVEREKQLMVKPKELEHFKSE
jgi:predicted ribosome quality control (RQC) complex YloA/Tae2 family protein